MYHHFHLSLLKSKFHWEYVTKKKKKELYMSKSKYI